MPVEVKRLSKEPAQPRLLDKPSRPFQFGDFLFCGLAQLLFEFLVGFVVGQQIEGFLFGSERLWFLTVGEIRVREATTQLVRKCVTGLMRRSYW